MHRRGFARLLLAAPAAMLAACGGTTVYDKNGTSTAFAGIGLPTATPAPTPAPAVAATPAMAAARAATSGGGMAAPAGDANIINVQGKDFAFTLDKSTVPAGNVRFVHRNMGPSPHNFSVRGNGLSREGQIINAGQTDNLDVMLRAGTYTYICTIAGHEQLGMKGEFTVQ